MRRKDCQRDAAFAWDVLEKADYATLSLIGTDGAPYAVPISPVADRENGVLYFHCASAGEKLSALKGDERVCLTAVGSMSVVPFEFTVHYASAAVHGRAEVVTDEGERVKAMLLLCQHYDPKGMGRFDESMSRYFKATTVVKIIPEELVGKEKTAQEPDPVEKSEA